MPYTATPTYKDVPKLRSNRRFLAAVERAIQLKQEIAERQDSYDEIRMQKILPEMIEAGVERVDFNGDQVGVVTRRDSTRIDREKLIVELEAAGVDLSILDRCSTTVDGYTYVEIRGAAEKKKKEDKFVGAVRRAVRIKSEERKIDRLQRLGGKRAG